MYLCGLKTRKLQLMGCKSKNPAVSVIIPTYNRAHLLGRAIQSVLDQTYQDFELIVVDDGSSDNTEDVVKSFNDKRIKYVRHEKNRGGAAARNTGIKAAKGEYIAFQDSDDEWLPEKLEKQMRVFEIAPREVGVVYTGFYRLENNKKTYIPSPKIIQKEGDIFSSLLKGNFVTTQAVLVKRECFKRVGMFDEKLPRLQDWELFIRISKDYQFEYIDEPLVISYYQPHSISADQNALIRALELILEKHFEDIKKDGGVFASYCLNLGHLLCSNGQLKQGRSYLIKAVKAYPLNIKALCAALVSLLGQGAYNRTAASYRKIRDCGFKVKN